MIGVLVQNDVRIRIKVSVRFGVRFDVLLNVQSFHEGNCRPSKCHGTISDQ